MTSPRRSQLFAPLSSRSVAQRIEVCLLAVLLSTTGCGGGSSSVTPPPPPPPPSVSVSVSPSNANVLLGNTQQFTATVTGTSNTSVTWSVNGVAGGNSAAGTISNSGLYTAPKDLPGPTPVNITATSQANSSASATVSVAVTSDINVSVASSPAGITSATVGATVQLAASISSVGQPDVAVRWSVNGITNGNSTVGVITTTGPDSAAYTVPTPALSPAVNIAATSVADPSKSASLMLTLNASVLGVGLSSSSLTFGSQGVDTVSPGQTVVLTNTGNGSLTINSIAVSGTNNSDFLEFNNCPGSSGTLTAGVPCTINLTFKPSMAAGEGALLTISDDAPGSPQTITLSGTGASQAVAIAPAQTTVQTGFTVPFIQTVTGLSDTTVAWSVNGIPGGDFTVGTITPGGIYTAPASVPSPSTITVTVASQAAPSLSASATATIVPPTVFVSVSPKSGTVQTGMSEQLTAVVTGTGNTAVTWAVNGVANGNPTVGIITTSAASTNIAMYAPPRTCPLQIH